MNRYDKSIPEKVLVLILGELRRSLGAHDKLEQTKLLSLGPYHSDDDIWINLIDICLKKFGIAGLEWEDYGFFWKLLRDNYNHKPGDGLVLTEPKKFSVIVEYDTTMWGYDLIQHEITSYCTNHDDIRAQTGSNPDFSPANGAFIRSKIVDSEWGDNWEIGDVSEIDEQISESKSVIKESESLGDTLPHKVLFLILQELQKEFGMASKIPGSPYPDITKIEAIRMIIKKFGIVNPEWQDYGFYWELLKLNYNLTNRDEMQIPKLKKVKVLVDVEYIDRGVNVYEHEVETYSVKFVETQLKYDNDFDVLDADVIDGNGEFEVEDFTITSVKEIKDNNKPRAGGGIIESLETKDLIKLKTKINAEIKKRMVHG